jgi:hypothetical protein
VNKPSLEIQLFDFHWDLGPQYTQSGVPLTRKALTSLGDSSKSTVNEIRKVLSLRTKSSSSRPLSMYSSITSLAHIVQRGQVQGRHRISNSLRRRTTSAVPSIALCLTCAHFQSTLKKFVFFPSIYPSDQYIQRWQARKQKMLEAAAHGDGPPTPHTPKSFGRSSTTAPHSHLAHRDGEDTMSYGAETHPEPMVMSHHFNRSQTGSLQFTLGNSHGTLGNSSLQDGIGAHAVLTRLNRSRSHANLGTVLERIDEAPPPPTPAKRFGRIWTEI